MSSLGKTTRSSFIGAATALTLNLGITPLIQCHQITVNTLALGAEVRTARCTGISRVLLRLLTDFSVLSSQHLQLVSDLRLPGS